MWRLAALPPLRPARLCGLLREGEQRSGGCLRPVSTSPGHGWVLSYCSQATPRVSTKVLAGSCEVGITEALSALPEGSPTGTTCFAGIVIVFRLWRAQKPTLPANVTQANLTWTPEARNLLSKDTASSPAAIISVLQGPATSAPHASFRQPVLSTEPKCRGGDTARVPLSAEELCWVSKPLLRYIWLEPLPQLQRGMRCLSQLFPRGKSPGKIIIKFVLNFSAVSFSVCSEKYPGKTNEILLNISIFCLLSNPNSSCVTACQEASAIMRTLLWQDLKTAKIV